MDKFKGLINKIVIAVIGFFLISNGIGNFKVSKGAGDKPAKVEVIDLEGDKLPDNNLVELGQHVRLYSFAVYSYNKKTKNINHTYYPVMSKELFGKFYKDVEKKLKVSSNEQFQSNQSFAVLVKTNHFKNILQLELATKEKPLEVSEKLEGLVVNQKDDLTSSEKQLIQSGFPNLNMEKLLVIEEGGKPSSYGFAFITILGGIVLVGYSAFSTIQSFRTQKVEPPNQQGDAGGS